jgi:hypothetical protein
MTLVISKVTKTGTGAAYTVPAGKIAKVRLTAVQSLSTGFYIAIGGYQIDNSCSVDVDTRHQGQNNGAGSAGVAIPVTGFVRASTNGTTMSISYLYIKEDHILVAGETMSCNDSGATIVWTIFEEDA